MRKKEVHEKELQGTLRKDRVKRGEDLEYLEKLKGPGKHLSKSLTERGLYLYNYFGEKLLRTKRLTELDLGNLVQLAAAWDKWLWAEEEMQRMNAERMGSGFKQVFKSGASNITTEFSVAEKAQDQIVKLSKMFGLSFKDRYGMQGYFGNQDGKQLSLWDEVSEMNENLKVVS